jgi:hypothetical protein
VRRRAHDIVFQYDAERCARADRIITALCEAGGFLDEYWRLGHRLIAEVEGAVGDDALRVLVKELSPAQRDTLALLLLEANRGR